MGELFDSFFKLLLFLKIFDILFLNVFFWFFENCVKINMYFGKKLLLNFEIIFLRNCFIFFEYFIKGYIKVNI